LSVVGATGEEIAVPVQPVLSKEAAAMLEHMLAFYDRLAEQGGEDTRLRRKVAEANRRVGDIRQRLGHYEESKAAYLRAIAAYKQLAQAAPHDVELGTEIARIQNELGNVYWAVHKPDAGHSAYLDALATLKATPPASAGTPRYLYELARTYYFLGKRPGREPGPPPIALGRRPGPPHEGHIAGGRHGPPWRPAGPKLEGDWRGPPPGSPPGEGGGPGPGAKPSPNFDPQEKQENLHKAIELLERLVAEHPGVPDYRHLLARCYREVRPGRPEDGPRSAAAATEESKAMNKALEILQRLADDYPNVPDYRQTYAMLDEQRMFSPQGADKNAGQRSLAMLEKGLAISEELVAEHPNVPDYALSQVYIRMRLAGVLQESDPAGAETQLQKALELQTALVRRFPKTTSYNFWMAVVQETLGTLLQQRGRLAESRRMQENSIAALEIMVDGDPHPGMLRGLLAYKYTWFADLLRQMKDEKGAAEALRKADQLRQSVPPHHER
jgi:tetratricopeptide (TPR) repeat protein